MINEHVNIIVNTIIGKYPNTESIWLYGSQAKGGHTDTSDVDICVKMPFNTHILRHDNQLNQDLTNTIGKDVHCVFCTINNEWMLKPIYQQSNTTNS